MEFNDFSAYEGDPEKRMEVTYEEMIRKVLPEFQRLGFTLPSGKQLANAYKKDEIYMRGPEWVQNSNGGLILAFIDENGELKFREPVDKSEKGGFRWFKKLKIRRR